MNLEFLIIVMIILLPCQRTWKGDSISPSLVGFSETAGVLLNKILRDMRRLIKMRTKLRELSALALHIIKMPLGFLGTISSINHGHLEMAKAIHCHFL